MFEIRVICDAADSAPVTAALEAAFRTGAVRRYPSRTPGKVRLYVTADHRPDPGGQPAALWPSPDAAYTGAPFLTDELAWVAETAAAAASLSGPDQRTFCLRKAAALDRLALLDDAINVSTASAEAATDAARHLLALDRNADGDSPGAGTVPPHTLDAARDPRGYLRQEYAAWHRQHLAAGRPAQQAP
ncbi:hypothetical protein AB0F64_03680 [Streptomyces sp. NPDC026294]|uniref:hypothetical protein n=1 Tax=Streptomyces sp. NPDC026294 TaxID=3155362 RepID=UPI0033F99A8E